MMSQIKNLKLLSITLFFLVEQVSAKQCIGLFTHNSRVEISQDIEYKDTPSILSFYEKKLPHDANQSLMELLQMTSYTRQGEMISQKNSSFKLGLDIGEGYSIEVTYELDQRNVRRFTAQDAYIVSPSNQIQKISSSILDFNSLKLKKNQINLNEFFPDGKEIKLNIPTIIEGPVLTGLEKMLQYQKFFSKEELKTYIRSNNYKKLKIVGHYRIAKDYLIRYLVRAPFKLIANTALFGGIMYIGSLQIFPEKFGFMPFKAKELNKSEIETAQTSLDKINKLQPEEIKSELDKLFVDLKNPKIDSVQLSSIESVENLWLLNQKDEATGTIVSYLVMTQEVNNSSQLNMIPFEINLEKNKYLVKKLTDLGQVINE